MNRPLYITIISLLIGLGSVKADPLPNLADHNKSTQLLIEYDYDARQLIQVISQLVQDQIALKEDVATLKMYVKNTVYVLIAAGLVVGISQRELLEEWMRS